MSDFTSDFWGFFVAAITPMFSAYVVTPVPPAAPETIVATPSPMNARPMY